jgi:hypothetical protein
MIPFSIFRGPDPVDCGTIKVMAWVNDTNVSLHNNPVCILIACFTNIFDLKVKSWYP